jgi:hypothetical protein
VFLTNIIALDGLFKELLLNLPVWLFEINKDKRKTMAVEVTAIQI